MTPAALYLGYVTQLYRAVALTRKYAISNFVHFLYKNVHMHTYTLFFYLYYNWTPKDHKPTSFVHGKSNKTIQTNCRIKMYQQVYFSTSVHFFH